jgi:hypothetical protein
MVGVAKGTVLRLLEEVGTACTRYHAENVRGLTCVHVQCDEIWSFRHAKERNIKPSLKTETIGDVWTWVGIDSDTKLVISYLCGQRTRRFAAALPATWPIASTATFKSQRTASKRMPT